MPIKFIGPILVIILLVGCAPKRKPQNEAIKQVPDKPAIALIANKTTVTIINRTTSGLTITENPDTNSTTPIREEKKGSKWQAFNEKTIDGNDATSTGVYFEYHVEPKSKLKLPIDTKLYKISRGTKLRYTVRVKNDRNAKIQTLVSNQVGY